MINGKIGATVWMVKSRKVFFFNLFKTLSLRCFQSIDFNPKTILPMYEVMAENGTYGFIAGSNAILWWWARMQRHFLTRKLINGNKTSGCCDRDNWIEHWKLLLLKCRGLSKWEWPVTSPRTGVAPGQQVGRRLLLLAVAGLAVQDEQRQRFWEALQQFFFCCCCWRK